MDRGVAWVKLEKFPGVAYAGSATVSKAKDIIEIVTVSEKSEAGNKFPLLHNGNYY